MRGTVEDANNCTDMGVYNIENTASNIAFTGYSVMVVFKNRNRSFQMMTNGVNLGIRRSAANNPDNYANTTWSVIELT